MVQRPPRRGAGPANQSRGNGPPAPASAAATAPGFVGGHATESFYQGAGEYEAESLRAAGEDFEDLGSDSPLAQANFVSTVRESSIPLETMGSADVEVLETMAAEESDSPTDLAQRIAEIRATRRPVGAFAQKLALPKRRGYHRHWFNDVAGRIDEAKANGWSHVGDAQGKPIARCVGTGRDKGAMFAFAMEIPEVFWLEDMDAKHRDAQAKVEGLKSSPFRAAPGTAQREDKGKFYDPSEHDAGPLQVVRAG